MTTVLAKGNFTSAASLQGDGEKSRLGMVKTFSSAISTAFDCSCNRTTLITINTDALEIAWLPNESYSVVVEEGFLIDKDSRQAGPLQTINFTTNPVATLESYSPTGTYAINNRHLYLTFNRGIKAFADGFLHLYKNSTLVQSINVKDAYNTQAQTLRFNVLGYIDAGADYHYLLDGNCIKDYDGIILNAITDPTDIQYTTSSSTNLTPGQVFPDLSGTFSTTANSNAIGKIVPYADRFLSSADFDFYYVEDVQNNILGQPTIIDPGYDGSGNYSLWITPSTLSAIKEWGTTTPWPGGGGLSWSTTDYILKISGTREQVNAYVDGVYFVTKKDYASNFSLSYRVTTPRGDTATKVQNMILGTPYDTEITNMIGVDRNYIGNKSNPIFSINTPYISDFDMAANISYNIKLISSTGGQFSSLSDYSDISSNWSFTGTKDQCNDKLSAIKYMGPTGVATNDTFVYQQYKNGTQQVSVTINLIGSGTLYDLSETLIFNSSGSWTPTYEQVRYGKFSALIVAGGGGGGSVGIGIHAAGSGGGGGGVKEILNQTPLNQTYPIVVGQGGLGCKYIDLFVPNDDDPSYDSSLGGTGGNSSAFGYTVTGGTGGYALKSFPYVTTTGGHSGASSGSSTFTGGTGRWAGTGSIYGGGGGGAGGIGGDYVQGIDDYSTTRFGGNGGTGVLSTITNQYYGGGGGGTSKEVIVSQGTRYIGLGGAGGGGKSGGVWAYENRNRGYDGTPNTGGGGGAGKNVDLPAGGLSTQDELEQLPVGGKGADGVVIIKVMPK